MFKMLYNSGAISRRNDRSRKNFVFFAEKAYAFSGGLRREALPSGVEGGAFF